MLQRRFFSNLPVYTYEYVRVQFAVDGGSFIEKELRHNSHPIIGHAFSCPDALVARDDSYTPPLSLLASQIPVDPLDAIGNALSDCTFHPNLDPRFDRNRPTSPYNPDRRKSNCVPLVISRLLGLPSVNYLYTRYNLPKSLYDTPTSPDQVTAILRKIKKPLVFQYCPDKKAFLKNPDDIFKGADKKFKAKSMGVCYNHTKEPKGGHCVIYHGSDSGRQVKTDLDRFVC
jgi:hypothetical protein